MLSPAIAFVEQLAEHFNARAGRLLLVGSMPYDFDFVANIRTMPRSTRPVTTVPRPEIENTSSIGIRNGWSRARSGVGMYAVERFGQLQ